MKATLVIVLSAMGVCLAQRPSYAGRIPVGYPAMDSTTPTTTTPVATPNTGGFGRIGSGASGNLGSGLVGDMSQFATTATTQKIPLEANGDANLIQRLNQLPVDKQPFWFLNWKALENLRSNQPQSYQFNDNSFLDFGSSPNRRNGVQRPELFF